MTVSVQPPWPGPASQATQRRVHRRPILIALMTSMALAAMDTTIVSTAIPQVVRYLGQSLGAAIFGPSSTRH